MPKLLVADDNQEMLDTLRRIFELYAFEVITVLNGQEAIAKARQESPDLILLDGMMPEMDGFDACKILKNDAATRDIPVVFLTANYIELHHRLKGLELGADDYLIKPFNSRELVARIKSILKRSELTRQLRAENNKLLEQSLAVEHQLHNIRVNEARQNGLIVDPVTGLYTYHFFVEHLKNELDRMKRYKQNMTIARMYIHQMNKMEELLGLHLFNLLIIRMANYILKKMRAADILSFNREKGFYILMPETGYDGAAQKVESIRLDLEQQAYLDDMIKNSMQVSRKKMSDLNNMRFYSRLVSVSSKDSHLTGAEKLLEALNIEKETPDKSEN